MFTLNAWRAALGGPFFDPFFRIDFGLDFGLVLGVFGARLGRLLVAFWDPKLGQVGPKMRLELSFV